MTVESLGPASSKKGNLGHRSEFEDDLRANNHKIQVFNIEKI